MTAGTWGNTLAGTPLHFSGQFTCRVGGSLTSSEIAFLCQLPSYCTRCGINSSSWSKGSFLLRAEKKAGGSGKTVACSLEGHIYTSIHTSQLSCPKRKKTGLVNSPDPSKSSHSEGFAHEHTSHFWSKHEVRHASPFPGSAHFCFARRHGSQNRGDSCPATCGTTFLH